jgi:CRP-like cAMP-binding protein
VAREAVQLVYVPAEQVRRVVLEHPAAASAFADLVDEQATWLTTMLDAAMQRRAVARVARKLLAELGTDECGLLRLTQDELAEMTTLSRNTINRVLAEFEDAGAIVAGYGRLAIADRARLRRAAGLAADEPRSPAETR